MGVISRTRTLSIKGRNFEKVSLFYVCVFHFLNAISFCMFVLHFLSLASSFLTGEGVRTDSVSFMDFHYSFSSS